MGNVTLAHALLQIRKWADFIEVNYGGEVLAALPEPSVVEVVKERKIAWGAKVSPTFKARVLWIESELGLPADSLMACMAWESGESFSPSKKNLAGSGATGLIQFMPSTAKGLGTTTTALAKMTAEDQLNYVYKYFKPFNGKLKNLGDVYMAILWPKGVGQPDSYVLFDQGAAYRQNAGLDKDKNGKVTRGECLVKIQDKLAKGLQTAYLG